MGKLTIKRKPLNGRIHALLGAVESICPLHLAADWDNVGLIAGALEWPAIRVMLAIDLTDAVAREALKKRANALVVYHPPIFKGITKITAAAESPTTILAELLAARISIVSVHTALDAAVGGTNDALLDSFDVVERCPLEPVISADQEFKLAVFVPAAELNRMRAALAAAGAGQIGSYSECSFAIAGQGSFRGDETTNPTIGRKQRLELVDEYRLEIVVPRRRLAQVVRALHAAHSYEEPAFDLYPLQKVEQRGAVGMGRIGTLRKPQTGRALLRRLAGAVDLSAATVVGELNRTYSTVVAAAGSFPVRELSTRPEALVLTGEIKHHDALQLAKAGVTAVCLGHDRSERPGLARLRERLAKALPGVRFELSKADVSPMQALKK